MAGLRALWLLLAAALGAGRGHPQPCRVPAPPGPAVRLGALLPPAARARLRAALATAAGPGGSPGGAVLPHNLSLELVAGGPAARDPGSLARWLCGALAGRGVAAVLALPRSRRELLQLDFLAAALQVPFVSLLDTRGPLPFRAQVRAAPVPVPAPAGRTSAPLPRRSDVVAGTGAAGTQLPPLLVPAASLLRPCSGPDSNPDPRSAPSRLYLKGPHLGSPPIPSRP